MTGVMKSQIDWLPLSMGGVRPTQGRTLAVMQVCGGSQSFNAVNALRVLGRWMRMVTIPNQSSVAKAWQEFDGNGRMKPSAYYDRVVDVMEELYKFTVLVPAGMAYAEAAGLPVVSGLYASLAALLAYALFGPSRILVLGPDSALVALIAASVAPLAHGNTEHAIALAGGLALLSGAICLVVGMLKLGFVTELLSLLIRYGY